MKTTVTGKGRATHRHHVQMQPTPARKVLTEKVRSTDDYEARLIALGKRRLVRGFTTDELMKMTRGDPASDPPPKTK